MARKKGDVKGTGSKRVKFDGRRWVPAPVKSATTKTGTRTRAQNRRSSSAAAAAKTKPALKPIPASKRPKDMQAGKVYGDAGRPYKGPGGNPNGSGQGQARQAPPAPKLPPKPRKPAASTAPVKSPKAPTKAKPKAATAANAQNLRSGPTPPKPKSKPRSWLKDNYKSGGPAKSKAGNNAKGRTSRLLSALNSVKKKKK